jgi:hypothetical protein
MCNALFRQLLKFSLLDMLVILMRRFCCKFANISRTFHVTIISTKIKLVKNLEIYASHDGKK